MISFFHIRLIQPNFETLAWSFILLCWTQRFIAVIKSKMQVGTFTSIHVHIMMHIVPNFQNIDNPNPAQGSPKRFWAIYIIDYSMGFMENKYTSNQPSISIKWDMILDWLAVWLVVIKSIIEFGNGINQQVEWLLDINKLTKGDKMQTGYGWPCLGPAVNICLFN